jgi:hypothetical protein
MDLVWNFFHCCHLPHLNFFFFFFGGTGVWTQGFTGLDHTSSPFLFWLFWRWNILNYFICLGWPQNVILSLSASQVARITGVSHQCLAPPEFLILRLFSLRINQTWAFPQFFFTGQWTVANEDYFWVYFCTWFH